MKVLRILLAILLPPLGVFLKVGLRGPFWLNVLLTLVGYVPGIVHAVWLLTREPEYEPVIDIDHVQRIHHGPDIPHEGTMPPPQWPEPDHRRAA